MNPPRTFHFIHFVQDAISFQLGIYGVDLVQKDGDLFRCEHGHYCHAEKFQLQTARLVGWILQLVLHVRHEVVAMSRMENPEMTNECGQLLNLGRVQIEDILKVCSHVRFPILTG